MNETELKQRTKQFALRIIRLCGALPNTSTGRAIGNQLVRCGTSVGSNYRAACRARSRAEFAAKVGIVVEEADECTYWLELVIESRLLKDKLVEPLLTEANELTAIMVSSFRTAQRSAANQKSRINGASLGKSLEAMQPQSKINNQKSKIT